MSAPPISPLDGRYSGQVSLLRDVFAEEYLFHSRVLVELAWLEQMTRQGIISEPLDTYDRIRTLTGEYFSIATRAMELTHELRHDVKAVEVAIREALPRHALEHLIPWVHFGLTGDDIESIVYARALNSAKNTLYQSLKEIGGALYHFTSMYAGTPMLAMTHGQPAVGTTFGKETGMYYQRLREQTDFLMNFQFRAKMMGAVGNANAAMVANISPEAWMRVTNSTIRHFGLEAHPYATQILPYDNWLAFFHCVHTANSILIGLCQDMWTYASRGIITIEFGRGSVGSSTMPQKANPIDFENAEGNLGLSNALIEYFERKLPISRMQRDLSDSTVKRTFGVALGHALVGYRSLCRALGSVIVLPEEMTFELGWHYETLAEGIQTILRLYGRKDGYDVVKGMMRGKKLKGVDYKVLLHQILADKNLPKVAAAKLRELSPDTYVGMAEKLAKDILRRNL